MSSLDGTITTLAKPPHDAMGRTELELFSDAIDQGASGIQTNVWLSADGEPVLGTSGTVGSLLRRRPIGKLRRSELPDGRCTLGELYDRLGHNLTVSLDVADPAAFDAVVETARQAGDGAETNLWLCHADRDLLSRWRLSTEARLAQSARMQSMKQSPEQAAAWLRERDVEGLRLFHSDWSPGLVTVLHRFERHALATGAVHEREIAQLVDIGLDAIDATDIERMMAVVAQFD